MNCAGNRSRGNGRGRTHIERNRCLICRGQYFPIGPGGGFHIAAEDISRHKAGDINGVFRAAVLRGVGEFGLFQIEYRSAFLDGHGYNIDPLVNPGLAYRLCAQ